MAASAVSKSWATGSDQRTGGGVPCKGINAPSTWTVVDGETVPGSGKPGWPITTVRCPSPEGEAILSWRASDWKSPPSPVRNCHE